MGGRHPGQIALMEQSGLDALEASQVANYCFHVWVAQQEAIGRLADLSDTERLANEERLRLTYGRPGAARVWYDAMKETLRADAVRYVENLLAQPG